ncbi:MAG: flagellar basal body rod protein FlgB [Polyangiaceae bacterium]|jgi:flagellar basal-body rod protein FlgB|nr:flagellar basal body rod protein FlgB [Polyangiaceae bacterium]
MDLLKGVSRLHGALDYHLARHNVLAANLSHLDTPNYRPQDLERVSDFRGAMHVALEATAPGHLPGASATRSGGRLVEDQHATIGQDGNAVSVDREAVKIASNQVRYDALSQLTGGALSSLVWAVTDGRGG